MCIGDLAPRPERWGRPDGGPRARVEAEYDIEKLNNRLEALYRSA